MNTISLLKPADLQRALQIEQRSHRFPWSEKTFRANQGERFLNFRIDADGLMAGFAITQWVLDEATLFNMTIDPDWQRCGLGRKLLIHVTDQLRQRGVNTLWLEVRALNHAAIALYQQLGFNEVALRRDYYPDVSGREDAIVMALPLAEGD